jgi:D-alanine-D-alanine ligase-like ATP-grasp enzyme
VVANVEQVRELSRRARRVWRRTQRTIRHEDEPIDRSAYFRRLWLRSAEAVGAEVVELPDGFLELRANGRSMRTFGPLVPLDDPVTLELAGHKTASSALLRQAGVPTAKQVVVQPHHLDPAVAFLTEHRAVVVKPQARTSSGAGVITHVRSERQLRRAVAEAASFGAGPVIVEAEVPGSVYRFLYLDGDLLDAVVRAPARVVGDGHRSVEALVRAENARRRELGDEATGLLPTGLELDTTLAASGRRRRSVPAVGDAVQVSGRSNTGDTVDSRSVLDSVSPDVVAAGTRAAGALGVRLAGVDIISADIGTSLERSGGVVSEINTTPGLHWHYLVAPDSPRVEVAQIIARRLLGLPTDAPGATARSSA